MLSVPTVAFAPLFLFLFGWDLSRMVTEVRMDINWTTRHHFTVCWEPALQRHHFPFRHHFPLRRHFPFEKWSFCGFRTWFTSRVRQWRKFQELETGEGSCWDAWKAERTDVLIGGSGCESLSLSLSLPSRPVQSLFSFLYLLACLSVDLSLWRSISISYISSYFFLF